MSASSWVGLVTLVLTIVLVARGRRRGWTRPRSETRGARPRRSSASVSARATPPARVGAGIAAAFLGRRNRMLAAAIADLAVRGAATLEVDAGAPAGRRILVRIDPRAEGRSPEEVALMRVLGAGAPGAATVLDTRGLALRGRLRMWTQRTMSRPLALGLLEHRTGLSKSTGTILAVVGFGAPAVDLIRNLVSHNGSAVTAAIDAVLAIAMVVVLATTPLVPTTKGWTLADALEGIDRLFDLGEVPRREVLRGTARKKSDEAEAELRAAERLLPYAIVLRRTAEWVEVLRGIAELQDAAAPGPDESPLVESELAAVAAYLADRRRQASLAGLYDSPPEPPGASTEPAAEGFGY